jgi:hypothetical protein
MEPTNEMLRRNTLARKKGCMHLAPGGEMIMALVSAVGWLVFLFEFAIV